MVANPAFCNLVGFTVDEMRGKHVRRLVPPEEIPIAQARMLKLLLNGTDYVEIPASRWLTKSGNTVTLRAHMQLLFLGGDFPRFVMFQGDAIAGVAPEKSLQSQECDKISKLVRVWSAWKENMDQSDKISGIDTGGIRFPKDVEDLLLNQLTSHLSSASPTFNPMGGTIMDRKDMQPGMSTSSYDESSPTAEEYQHIVVNGSHTNVITPTYTSNATTTQYSFSAVRRDWDWDEFLGNQNQQSSRQQDFSHTPSTPLTSLFNSTSNAPSPTWTSM